MSIVQQVKEIEAYVFNNTSSEVHFDGTEFIPNSKEWIHLLVTPIDEYNYSLNQCTISTGMVSITCYGETKVKAGELVDKMIELFQNKSIKDIDFRGFNLNGQGSLQNGTFFYRIIFLYSSIK